MLRTRLRHMLILRSKLPDGHISKFLEILSNAAALAQSACRDRSKYVLQRGWTKRFGLFVMSPLGMFGRRPSRGRRIVES